MTTASSARLASYQRRYRKLAQKLAEIGYIASGSIALRANRCGKANCACHADPPQLHGPYRHFTAKVNGKTVNKRLTEHEANLYQEWIANDRAVRATLTQMRDLAAKAQALILAEAAAAPHEPDAPSPQNSRTDPGRRGPRP